MERIVSEPEIPWRKHDAQRGDFEKQRGVDHLFRGEETPWQADLFQALEVGRVRIALESEWQKVYFGVVPERAEFNDERGGVWEVSGED